MITSSALKEQKQDDTGDLFEDGRWASAARNSIRQSIDFLRWFLKFCVKTRRRDSSLASKRNKEICQVTVAVA